MLENDSWVEPTVDEVLNFGESIGLPRLKINQDFPYWFNALHEVAHWAVKPDWYIKEWEKLKKRKISVPNAPCLKYYYNSEFYDPTPNEIGVRAWAHLILNKKHWIYPTKKYFKQFVARSRRAYKLDQWCDFDPCNGYIDRMNGFEQLAFAGIDIKHNIYRSRPQFGKQLMYDLRYLLEKNTYTNMNDMDHISMDDMDNMGKDDMKTDDINMDDTDIQL